MGISSLFLAIVNFYYCELNGVICRGEEGECARKHCPFRFVPNRINTIEFRFD